MQHISVAIGSTYPNMATVFYARHEKTNYQDYKKKQIEFYEHLNHKATSGEKNKKMHNSI